MTSPSASSPVPVVAYTGDAEMLNKTLLSLPLKRNLVDVKFNNSASASKRIAITYQMYQPSTFQTLAPICKGLWVAFDCPTSSHCGRTNFNNVSTENLDNSQGTP
jgi:DDB1- and CUL4-associated factor 1